MMQRTCQFESVNGSFCPFETVKVQLLQNFKKSLLSTASSLFCAFCLSLKSAFHGVIILFCVSVHVNYFRSLPPKAHQVAVFIALTRSRVKALSVRVNAVSLGCSENHCVRDSSLLEI